MSNELLGFLVFQNLTFNLNTYASFRIKTFQSNSAIINPENGSTWRLSHQREGAVTQTVKSISEVPLVSSALM